MSDQITRFCHYEKDRFPTSEFEKTDKYGVVHKREPLHTDQGNVINTDPDPGRIPGPLDQPHSET